MENSTLIEEINQLRQDKKRRDQEVSNLRNKVKSLSGALAIRERTTQGSVGQQSAGLLPLPSPPPGAERASSAKQKPTPFQGRLYKGSTMESRFSALQDRQRISELQAELDEKREQNFYLKMELSQMREILAKATEVERSTSITRQEE
jgi:regulator of replication initiation timing